jgi:DNA ligase N terminus
MNRPDPPGERGSDFLEVSSFSFKYYPLTEITEVDDDDEESDGDNLNDNDIKNDDDKSETNSLESISYHHENTVLQAREDDCEDEIIEAQTFLDGADMQTMPNESSRDVDSALTSTQGRMSVTRHDSPTTDPSEAISFYRLCTRLESVWRQRFRKSIRGRHAASSTRTKEQIFGLLVDDSLRSYLADSSSWFPFWRLIMPDLDTTRPHTGMKERTIALAWADAMNLTPGSRPYQRLLHYSDPTYFGDVGKSNLSATSSDLSLAIQEVVEPRDGTQGSKLTIKHINDMLDDLVAIKGGTMFQPIRSNHDWRETNSQSKKRQGPSLRQRRCDWVNQLRSKKLSALEHKWLVRILLQKMELGFSSKSMLGRWMPSALDVYRMNNNLKSVCLTVSNPMWIQALEEKKKNEQLLHEKSHKLYVSVVIRVVNIFVPSFLITFYIG